MSELIVLNKDELERKSSDVVQKAEAFVVADQDSYTKANQFIKVIKAVAKEVKDTFNPIVEKAHAAWKEANAQKAKFLEPLETAERTLKNKATAFYAVQEGIRREQEGRARRDAEKKAEKERARLNRLAEAERAIAEAERYKAEAMARKETDEALAAEIRRQAEEKDAQHREKAEALEARAETVEAVNVTVAPRVEAPKGVSYREVWSAVVVSMTLLPDEYKVPDMKKLNEIAREQRETARVPGVKFVCDKVQVNR